MAQHMKEKVEAAIKRLREQGHTVSAQVQSEGTPVLFYSKGIAAFSNSHATKMLFVESVPYEVGPDLDL